MHSNVKFNVFFNYRLEHFLKIRLLWCEIVKYKFYINIFILHWIIVKHSKCCEGLSFILNKASHLKVFDRHLNISSWGEYWKTPTQHHLDLGCYICHLVTDIECWRHHNGFDEELFVLTNEFVGRSCGPTTTLHALPH